MHVHSLGAMHQQDKTSLACSTYTVSKPRFSGVNEIHTYAPSESTRTAFFCCLQGNLIKHRSPCVDSRKTNLCSLGSLVPGVELRSRLIVARIYDADILVLAVGYIFRTIMIPVDGLNGFGVIIIWWRFLAPRDVPQLHMNNIQQLLDPRVVALIPPAVQANRCNIAHSRLECDNVHVFQRSRQTWCSITHARLEHMDPFGLREVKRTRSTIAHAFPGHQNDLRLPEMWKEASRTSPMHTLSTTMFLISKRCARKDDKRSRSHAPQGVINVKPSSFKICAHDQVICSVLLTVVELWNQPLPKDLML